MRRVLVFVFLLLAPAVHASTAFNLASSLLNETENGALLSGAWKYHTGDDPRFAAPDYDDTSWATVAEPWELPEAWNGAGWFRLHLRVAPELMSTPLALFIRNSGNLELYINGRKDLALEPGPRFQLNPLPVVLPSPDVLIAVRYSNSNPSYFSRAGFYPGIALVIGSWNVVSGRIYNSTKHQILLIGILMSFGIIHLLLFLFHREQRVHFAFSMLTLSTALMVFTECQDSLVQREAAIWMRRLWGIGMIGISLSALRFTYYLQGPRMPRQFSVLAAAGVAILVWGWKRLNGGWYHPAGAENYISLFTLVLLLEMGRCFVTTMRKAPSEAAVILGLGSVPVIVTGIYQILINFGIVEPALPFFKYVPLPYYAVLFLVVSMSVHLSRHVAGTNRELQRQLEQVKELSEQRLEQERRAQQQELERRLLEVDNKRKTAELEEARRLQLSMLPKKVPLIPGLEACFYMKTATEVGGDYYDFYRNSDTELTIAVGDATGHGMQAGTMVAAVKGLFQNLAGEKDLAVLLTRMSEVLKRMNLGRMYMAMTLARFQDNRVQLVCAGMPPPLLYRAAGQQVEEVRLRGMWLGGAGVPYEKAEMELAPGDALLMMSDGYPELFNTAEEILGYSRAGKYFQEAASEQPGRVISSLVQRGEEWAGGRALEDDITFSLVRFAVDRHACYPCAIEVSSAGETPSL